MRQRLFYKPPKKWPRMLGGAMLGLLVIFVLLRAGLDARVSDPKWLLPLLLSLPAGAVGGYLFALLDPMRAKGHGFIANLLGGALYLVLLSAALAVGVNGGSG